MGCIYEHFYRHYLLQYECNSRLDPESKRVLVGAPNRRPVTHVLHAEPPQQVCYIDIQPRPAILRVIQLHWGRASHGVRIWSHSVAERGSIRLLGPCWFQRTHGENEQRKPETLKSSQSLLDGHLRGTGYQKL